MAKIQKTIATVSDYITEYDGSCDMMIRLFTELIDLCDQIIHKAAKRWKYRNQFAALRDEFATDVGTLCGESKIISLPVILALRNESDDYVNDQLDRFYELCHGAGVVDLI